MYYKFSVMPQGPVGTPFHSATIFGHACWHLLFTQGEKELERFIESARDGEPQIVFSDGFPSGYLPRPLIPVDISEHTNLKEYSSAKRRKKQIWVNAENFKTDCMNTEDIPSKPLIRETLHNIIDRFTATSLQKNGLYQTDEHWYFDKWKNVDIYLFSTWGSERINKFIEGMLSTGYGRDQTQGFGNIKISAKPSKTELCGKNDSPWFMSLSHCIPDSSVIKEKSFYRIDARYGKVWDGLGAKNPFKKPLMEMVPGSVLYSEEKKEIFGMVKNNVLPGSKTAVIENCMAIPCSIPGEVCNG